jgi:hypothetical protein
MKSRFYKIKFTAASDQVLNCQPKIVILNNICYSVTTSGVRVQSSKLGGSPKPVACKIVHGRIK